MNGTANEDEIGAEARLALHYAPRDRRDALGALWALDARMRRIFVEAREPAIAQIKLAWWEERLAALRQGHAPAEPLLERLADDLAGIADAGVRLSAIPAAWRGLFAEVPWPAERLDGYARERGRGVMALGAEVLGAAASEAQLLAGEGQALFDLAVLHQAGGDAVMAAAAERFRLAGRFVWPRAVRPLGMIAELARRDALANRVPIEGSPARIARMAWHALSGR